MQDRRKFIKTVAAGTGGLVVSSSASAQNVSHISGIVTYLLDEPQIVTTGSASGSVLITNFNVTQAAASTSTLTIGIAASGSIE
ncbi:hypothetical protein GCM10008090_30440 [Arenicella chitinivorans]|uniref:Twin-arginine translocation signal domain-containing protein n=1 Tax=Arenicella chitinivorans TaxID=1329800 RepID=A0A918VQ53_9GAMM|nr:twin-arginine translocation signal domain-containing protein [Arenicella chitinivorans]GHA18743.1 hypothetical protein GCM10008090_30440 [Arenicella chitinivorans]